MANTKISQLPSYTGTAADLRWFVMNNSGETTTFKFSGYTSPYKRLGTNNSNNTYDTAAMVGTFSSIVGGEINQIQGGTHNFIGGGYNNILNSNTRNNYAIVGGADNTADSESGFGLMTGQYNINQGRWGFVAGRSNTINQNNAQFCLGWGNTMTGDNSDTLGIFGSYSNTLDVSSTQAATIIGSSNSQLRTRGTYGQHNGTTIFGSNSSYIKESPSNNNKYSGSRNGIILSNECGLYNSNYSNYLDHSLILSSSASTIYDSSNSQIIGGVGNTISGKTNVVMVGCSGRTADASNTTFVENLHTYRTPSTQVQPISSGTTFTCNLDNGAKSQFYITGTSTINITNVRDGASFMIKTQTDGNYVMTWTATGGYTFVFEGGLKDPGNSVIDIFKFEVFGNVIYGSRAHNFS